MTYILVVTKMIIVNRHTDSSILAVIASPRRREILRLVWWTEMAAGDIHRAMPDVTFGAVSLQLRTLARAGLVRARADGRHRLYRARKDDLGSVAKMLERMWDDALWRLRLLVDLERTRRGPRARRRNRRNRKQ